VPSFDLDLEAKNDIVKYVVTADDKMIDEQVVRIQKQFGTPTPQTVVEESFDISGTFTNAEKEINTPATITVSIFKDKKTGAKFIGKKVGDVVTVNTKGLFDDDHQLMDVLKVSHDDVHGLTIDVDFKIEKITGTELAELNQELFDKLFGPGNVATLEELKTKIKEDAEIQFAQQADQKLMADVTDFLVENTKFDLPDAFLKRWLQTVGEKNLSPEEAEVEYARSEKGLRYQLIEGRALSQANIQITFEDLKAFTAKSIRQQMAQFGQTNPTDEEVQGIVARVLSNQEEVKKLSDQVVGDKLLLLFKEKANATVKEVTYPEFIAASYGE
jgi:trigger factor